MQVKLIIEGKEYQAEMEQKQVDSIVNTRRTGYERVSYKEGYYSQNSQGVFFTKEDHGYIDELRYKGVLYINNDKLSADVDRADTLMRQLRRFAVEENAKTGIELDWRDSEQPKFFIYYDFGEEYISIAIAWVDKTFAEIYFASHRIAQNAINTYKSELTWYFTEYCDHLK